MGEGGVKLLSSASTFLDDSFTKSKDLYYLLKLYDITKKNKNKKQFHMGELNMWIFVDQRAPKSRQPMLLILKICFDLVNSLY